MRKFMAIVIALLVSATALPLALGDPGGNDSEIISTSTYTATVSRRIPPTRGAGERENTQQADLTCARYESTTSAVFVADPADPEPDPDDDADAEPEAAPMGQVATAKTTSQLGPNPSGKMAKSAAVMLQVALFQDDDGSDVPDLDLVVNEVTSVTTVTTAIEGGVIVVTTTVRCIAYYHCNAERIDDVRLGQIAGQAPGAYAEYVQYVGGIITHVGGTQFPDFELDLGQVGESLTANIGAQPSLAHMPIMYYCRTMYNDPSRSGHGEIEIAAAGFYPQFDWGTNVLAEYDIPGTRADLLVELLAALDGRRPQMQTIPPVETGYTFVKLPMWLWIEEPLELVEMDAINDLGTVRLATRATLRHVEWLIDGVPIICTLDQMTAFEHGVDSITDAPPFCMHRFEELTDYTMMATAVYDIQEQLSFRGATTFEWSTTGWIDHPSNPEIPLANETPPMSVREIISVTVPVGITAEELDALSGSG